MTPHPLPRAQQYLSRAPGRDDELRRGCGGAAHSGHLARRARAQGGRRARAAGEEGGRRGSGCEEGAAGAHRGEEGGTAGGASEGREGRDTPRRQQRPARGSMRRAILFRGAKTRSQFESVCLNRRVAYRARCSSREACACARNRAAQMVRRAAGRCNALRRRLCAFCAREKKEATVSVSVSGGGLWGAPRALGSILAPSR